MDYPVLGCWFLSGTLSPVQKDRQQGLGMNSSTSFPVACWASCDPPVNLRSFQSCRVCGLFSFQNLVFPGRWPPAPATVCCIPNVDSQ